RLLPALRAAVGRHELAGQTGLDVLPREPDPDALDRLRGRRPLRGGAADLRAAVDVRRCGRSDAHPHGPGAASRRHRSGRGVTTAAGPAGVTTAAGPAAA